MPKKIEENLNIGEVLHEWNIPEYEQHERNKAWYIIMGLIGFALITYSLLSSNFLFSLILILFIIIIFLQAYQDPIVIPFLITDLGVIINDRFYSYSELDEFYIIYNPEEDLKMLYIETVGNFTPRLRLPLMDNDPNEIRITMRSFIEENIEKEQEPFSDMIGRKWRLH
ncbi:MAG: hypothetical protein COY69_03600 [Candidatus Magasanikbacteria bacterium CG_4_10_14_0_8_um_filter_32_14]|uniref:DUF5673 domain-containing protein n=1 Tax=Candidatus Magasanikbacteria bacterium CG_4_10_14_0_8_um_filter_32_14 TaxID=1974640 RepID=A0A2M7R8G9_9BACT|nr:MAG: hypothetical protein COY69_03600 [Candidatus Magasanikbacteria bacterium CG_4_10_14_0_8_um_filter_32_14]